MAWRVTKHRPRYLKSELVRTYAGEQPDYFDVEKNKWFSCDTGSELIGTINGVAYNGSAYVLAPTVIVNAGDNLTTLDPLTYDYPVAEMSFTTIVGDMYEFSFQLNRTDNGIVVYTSGSTLVGSTIASKSLLIPTTATLNTYKVTLVAQTTTTFIHIWSASVASGALTKIDNLTCFPVEITPTTEIPESRNYMNHIVHADSQGNPLFVEELPKNTYIEHLVVGQNRKVINLGTIYSNNRYVVENPFGNEKYMDCDVRAEIYWSGRWEETGIGNNAGTGSNGYFTQAYSKDDGINILTGATAIGYTSNSVMGGSFKSNPGMNITSAPARIIVTYVGVAK